MMLKQFTNCIAVDNQKLHLMSVTNRQTKVRIYFGN